MRVTILKLLRGSQTNRFKLYCTISLMFTQSVSVALYSRDTRSFQRFLTVAKLQRDTWMPNIRPEKPGLWNSPLELHDGQWQQDEDRAWTGPWCRGRDEEGNQIQNQEDAHINHQRHNLKPWINTQTYAKKSVKNCHYCLKGLDQ